MAWPASTTMSALSVTGKAKTSAGGTNPPAAVWFPPSAQAGGMRRRAPSSAPPSTPDPSSVSSLAAVLPFRQRCVALTLTSLPVLLFCIFHHAHILEKHACRSLMSRFGLAFGLAAALGAFVAGNCNPGDLPMLHYLGAALSFMSICFFTSILTALTRLCVLSGYERILYPLRTVSAVLQVVLTIGYAVLFVQVDYVYHLLSAVFEWTLGVNLQLFQLSFAVEFCFFSSFMLANIFGTQEDEKPLMLTTS